MKREIKFRAFVSNQTFKSDNGMVYMDGEVEEDGYFCTGNSLYKSYYDREDSAICKYKVDAEIMQFIGLKDKNGRDIYEGDILMCEAFYSSKSLKKKTHKAIVKFSLGGFEPKSIDEIIVLNFDNCEVIGNVYENPDLLQNKNS